MKIDVRLILCIGALLGTLGCSSLLEKSRKLIDDEEAKQMESRKKAQAKIKSKWVKRSEFDDLNVKYKNLSDKYETLLKSKAQGNTSFDQIEELAKSTPPMDKKNSQLETVDVFGKGGLATQVEKLSSSVGKPSLDNEPNSITRELKTYKKALSLKQSGRVDDSLRVFQFLEKSNFEQIQVRARMEIANIYLEKNQFDLSLQVFEKVIATNAFSGKILEALKGAASSAQGLGLTDKKLRYESMLKDFFGIKS